MDTAKIFLFNEEKLLLLYHPIRGRYDLPGGSIEEGEEPEEAGIRGTHEETGFTIDTLVGPIHTNEFTHPKDERIVRVGYFHATTEEENPELSEHLTHRWERPKDALRYTLLESIRDAITNYERNTLLYQNN